MLRERDTRVVPITNGGSQQPLHNQLLASPARRQERACLSGQGDETSIITGQKMGSNQGAESCGGLHRERGLTPRTRKIACSHTPVLQHVEQCLFQTIWTDVVFRETGKRIDRRTTVKLREFILASQHIGDQSNTAWSSHRTHSDPHVAIVPSTFLRP